MRLADVLRGSKTYRTMRTLRRWAANSTAVALLCDARVLKALVGALVLVSVVSILGADLGAAVKFLSFLVLFTVVAAIAWPVAEPPTD